MIIDVFKRQYGASKTLRGLVLFLLYVLLIHAKSKKNLFNNKRLL